MHGCAKVLITWEILQGDITNLDLKLAGNNLHHKAIGSLSYIAHVTRQHYHEQFYFKHAWLESQLSISNYHISNRQQF